MKNQFGVKVMRARRRKGWPMREVGRRVGVSFQQIGRYESGVSMPRADTLKRLADALDVSIDELMGTER